MEDGWSGSGSSSVVDVRGEVVVVGGECCCLGGQKGGEGPGKCYR